MRISLGTRLKEAKGVNGANGYGYATNCMIDSLRRLGYHVEANDSSADVEIWFDQPHQWNFSKGPYRIGYHPWESTELKEGWADIMNNDVDEIWTPSPLIAEWYGRYAGVRAPVYVYEHGIEHSWSPVKRERGDKVRFLHVGAEAARKGGWETVQAFRAAFGKGRANDVELTLKMISPRWNGINYLGKVHYLDEKMSLPDLQKLFYSHDAYVYPSFGEGFGLTPLQSIATAMPTITLPGWAPYHKFLDNNLNINHKMIESPWPRIHPGEMMQPDFDEVVDRMRYFYDNYEKCSTFAYEQAPAVHDHYDWDAITAQVFKDLEARIK